MFGSELSPAQKRMLLHIVNWGGLGSSAEDDTGLQGAAFEAVLESLRTRGYANDDYEPTGKALDASAALKLLARTRT